MTRALGGECIQLWSDSVLEWKLRAVVLLFGKSRRSVAVLMFPKSIGDVDRLLFCL